jgi:hypothetical protein
MKTWQLLIAVPYPRLRAVAGHPAGLLNHLLKVVVDPHLLSLVMMLRVLLALDHLLSLSTDHLRVLLCFQSLLMVELIRTYELAMKTKSGRIIYFAFLLGPGPSMPSSIPISDVVYLSALRVFVGR